MIHFIQHNTFASLWLAFTAGLITGMIAIAVMAHLMLKPIYNKKK